MTTNSRGIAAAHETAVVACMREVGCARPEEIRVWLQPTHQLSTQMARRTCERLRDRGILGRQVVPGNEKSAAGGARGFGFAYGLTPQGLAGGPGWLIDNLGVGPRWHEHAMAMMVLARYPNARRFFPRDLVAGRNPRTGVVMLPDGEEVPLPAKWPDGWIIEPPQHTIVEIEGAAKTGPKARHQFESISDWVSHSDRQAIVAYPVLHPAFRKASHVLTVGLIGRDPHNVDHRTRLLNGFRAQALTVPQMERITIMELQVDRRLELQNIQCGSLATIERAHSGGEAAGPSKQVSDCPDGEAGYLANRNSVGANAVHHWKCVGAFDPVAGSIAIYDSSTGDFFDVRFAPHDHNWQGNWRATQTDFLTREYSFGSVWFHVDKRDGTWDRQSVIEAAIPAILSGREHDVFWPDPGPPYVPSATEPL